MHALSTEHHTQTNSADMATNIAQHLAEHRLYGQAVIVADNPQVMLRQVQRAWRRVGTANVYKWKTPRGSPRSVRQAVIGEPQGAAGYSSLSSP